MQGLRGCHDVEGRCIGVEVGPAAGIAHDSGELIRQGAEAVCGSAIGERVGRGFVLRIC